jgi:Lon protease-like protein
MTNAENTTIGLFPLGLVVLPGELLPLHIFEPRYRRLIAEVRAGGDEFGIVLRNDDAVAECGCTVRLVEVLEEFDDGRLNILVEGRRRFRLFEIITPADEAAECLRARVVCFEDEAEDEEPGEAVEGIRDRALALFARVLGLTDVETPRPLSGDHPLSFRLVAAVDLGVELKQQLLELRSEAERLTTLIGVMESLIPRLELRRQREEAIRGNGKGN